MGGPGCPGCYSVAGTPSHHHPYLSLCQVPHVPHPREGKGLPGDACWKKGLFHCLLPIPAVMCPPPLIFCTETMCPVIGCGGCSCRPRVPSPSALCWCGTSASCSSPVLPCHPAHAHTLSGTQKPGSTGGGLPGLSGSPPSTGSGGWPSLGHPGVIASQNPIQEPVPAGLEMLYIYESIFFPPL